MKFFFMTLSITLGEPVIKDIVPLYPEVTRELVLSYAASLEKNSEHPISRSIVNFVEKIKLKFPDSFNFKTIKGLGTEANICGGKFKFGNPRWFIDEGYDFEDIDRIISSIQNKGRTVMLLADEKNVLGLISMSDVLNPESVNVIKDLHDENLNVILLTGNNIRTANVIAKKLRGFGCG